MKTQYETLNNEPLQMLEHRLKESKAKSDALDKQVSELTNEQHGLKLQIAEVKFGVTVGCIVVSRDGKRFRVTQIDVRWRNRPWLEGNPQKKDGTFGTAHRNLYDEWTLEQAHQCTP